MKNAHIIVEQLNYQKPKPQEQQLVLEDISSIWASHLKKENLPTFMSLTWWEWQLSIL